MAVRFRSGLWILASLPFLPMALVFWAFALPPHSEGAVISLVGTWEGHEAAEGFDPQRDETGWRPLRLPGSFTVQGFEPAHLWVKRRFELPQQLAGGDASFVIGNVRGATLRLTVNGEPIGVKGIATEQFLGVEAGAETYFVPSRILQQGQNTLLIEVRATQSGRDGIIDPRLLFGRHDVLAPWAFHEQQTRAVLEQGVLVVIAFLIILLVALWVLQGEKTNRDLYRSTLLLMGASAAYLLGKSGFLVSATGSSGQLHIIIYAVFGLGLAIGEFIEAYYLQRATWFRWVDRAVTAGAMITAPIGNNTIYRLYTLWLFVAVIYAVALGVRDLIKRITLFGPLVVMGTFIVSAAGVLDLLGDLDVVYLPRLFTFAIANLAIMSGAVVVAEFLQLARENTRLSSSLQLRNEELADALVKAEEGSRIKSEFLANTSHELRTPLNAIINIPQGLLEQFHDSRRARCSSCSALFELESDEAPPSTCPSCSAAALALESSLTMDLSPDETSRLLKSIVRSGNHLLAVVNDILDYSKLEAGRVVLHKESTSVDSLLEDLRLAMEPVASLAGVKLALSSSAIGVHLDIDRVKISQVLINLVGNAIKFSDGKGTVSVSASSSDSAVTLSVKDEGIGIAPENQALIFEGFRQVEGSNTRRFGGSGLGLAISKRLVSLHGGSLRVESSLGHGSTFFIELPLISSRPEDAALPSDAQLVLVVDDEASALDTTAVALKPLGCRVLSVSDPRDALARLREARPALLVLDVMMPRVSGLELLRQLRADPSLSDLPVLVSSAFPDNQRAVEALGATFIAKPWRAGELLRAATGLLAQRRAG